MRLERTPPLAAMPCALVIPSPLFVIPGEEFHNNQVTAHASRPRRTIRPDDANAVDGIAHLRRYIYGNQQ